MDNADDLCERIKAELFLPEIAVYTGIIALVAAGIILAFKNHDAFDYGYVISGGPIGWLTVPALVGTAILSFLRFRLGRKARAGAFTIFWLLCTLLFIFGSGEKMAWGQRIVRFETPQYFKVHNAKAQLSIHRLVIGGVDIGYPIFDTGLGILVVLYVFVFPAVYKRKEKVKLLADRLGMPVPRKRHTAAYALIYLLICLTASHARGEVVELAGAWQFLLIGLYPENGAAMESAAGLPPGSV